MSRKKLSLLFNGAAVLALSNVAVKAAGMLFKIPMTALIGEEGMGYFNSAYSIFTYVYMISAAGLPAAASMVIARLPKAVREDGARRVLRVSVTLFSVIGALGFALLYFGADLIAGLMRVENAAPAIAAVSPTVIFVTLSAALRGYFQGLSELRPHAASQVVEAMGKLTLGLGLAYYVINKGSEIKYGAASASVGIAAGVCAGTVLLLSAFIIRRKAKGEKCTASSGRLARDIMRAAIPVTLSSGVMSLAGLMDSFIMTRQLHASGMSQAEAAAVWGNYSSLAAPLFNLPPVITMPIAYALLPKLTSALAVDDIGYARELTADAYRKTLFFAVPSAVGLCAMSSPILSLLFDSEVARRGEILLTLLAPSSMLLCLLGLMNTILQASGHFRAPMVSMLAGALLKLALSAYLTPILGSAATPISTFACYFTACAFSGAFIAAKTSLGAFPITYAAKPLVLSLISVTVGVMLQPILGSIPAIAVTAAAYFVMSYAAGERSWNTNKRKESEK